MNGSLKLSKVDGFSMIVMSIMQVSSKFFKFKCCCFLSETVHIIPYQYYYGSFWKVLQWLLFSQLKRMHVYVWYVSFSSSVVEIYLFVKPLDLI